MIKEVIRFQNKVSHILEFLLSLTVGCSCFCLWNKMCWHTKMFTALWRYIVRFFPHARLLKTIAETNGGLFWHVSKVHWYWLTHGIINFVFSQNHEQPLSHNRELRPCYALFAERWKSKTIWLNCLLTMEKSQKGLVQVCVTFPFHFRSVYPPPRIEDIT